MVVDDKLIPLLYNQLSKERQEEVDKIENEHCRKLEVIRLFTFQLDMMQQLKEQL